MRLSSWTIVSVGTAIIAVCALIPTPQQEVADRRISDSATYIELVHRLAECRRTWLPDERKKLYERLGAEAQRFEEPLRLLLAQPGHQMLPEAITAAGAMRLAVCLPQLVWFAAHGSVRSREAAIRSAAKLSDWSSDQLEGFLADPNPVIVIAAIDAALDKVPMPIDILLPLLDSHEPKVREAAIHEIPRGAGPEEVAQLITFARNATGPGKLAAIEALGSAPITSASETYLMELAQGFGPELRMSALASLAKKAAPLEGAKAVWRIASDYQLSLAIRARAMRCLELTRGPILDHIRSVLWNTDQVTRYLAGRVLVADGALDGVELLATLLADDFGELDRDRARLLDRETRTILAMVTGLSWDSPPEQWREWHGSPKQCALPESLLGIVLQR